VIRELAVTNDSTLGNLKIRADDWILVCDGKKALILENVGTAEYPKLRVKATHEHEDPRTHDLGTDAPGRVFPSVGKARSAVQSTDWHEQAERAFLRTIVEELLAATADGQLHGMVVVAPPRALGILRELSPSGFYKLVRSEIGRDYTHLPVHELERRLFS
jgi:protein required for attachment to host cells